MAPKLAEILVKIKPISLLPTLAVQVWEKVASEELRGHPATEGHLGNHDRIEIRSASRPTEIWGSSEMAGTFRRWSDALAHAHLLEFASDLKKNKNALKKNRWVFSAYVEFAKTVEGSNGLAPHRPK
jgi:hypothetical protein